ncbi:response regulator [Bacillus sp. FJAT-22090]|uniref:response regulator n=1 Tax=Bacillus sp. FJAT-22090 TaxID=1581038 RepID=UPI0011A2A8F0|nr:response regulator [Bacillus sp. FJAT-22090]
MRVLLVDDEEIALDVNEIRLNELEGVEVVGKYTNPYLALEQLEKVDVDVVFLDMEMGGVHGLELAEMITSQYSHLEILFVTAYPQYALEAFEVNAIDYLLKPLNKKRLKKAIEKTQKKLELYKESKNLIEENKLSFYAKTLGSFHLLDGQHNIVKWRTKKVKELFLFLWQHQGTSIHKTVVMEQLWPDVVVDKATTLLHTTVYQLRKTFKENGLEDAILFVNDHYALNISIDSDYAEVERLLTIDSRETASVEKILTLYTGDFLEEEDFKWGIVTQQCFKQLVLNYLEHVVTKSEASHELIEKCLLKMLVIDCYNETYMYKLLYFYKEMNNRVKLREYYRIFENKLRVDLGIEIPFEMQELYEQTIEK